MSEDVYEKLSQHLASLGMGYPAKEELLEILRSNFNPLEAEVALAIPTKVIPFETAPVSEIALKTGMPEDDAEKILASLANRGLLFSKKTKGSETGYALQQFGYGFPQTFFWGGLGAPNAKKMAGLIARYARRDELHKIHGSTETKAFRYVPAAVSLDPESHAVFPFEMMDQVIEKAHVIALVHCACRATAELLDKRQCENPLELCVKYDELAEYVIDKGLAKEITKEEARAVMKKSEDLGLVHLVDNAKEGIKHTCNCCSCCCWSVGTIRRRKMPRDVLMATYFLRETDSDKCTGCGQCVDICPVNAITMVDDIPVIDREWCIGCGVCAVPCPASAVILVRKSDVVPPKDFKTLHTRILKERKNSVRQ